MQIAGARLEVGVLDLFLTRDIRIEDAVVAGGVLDFSEWIRLRGARRPSETALENLFSGIFPYTEWGYRLWIDNLQFEGAMRFPDERTVAFELSGGGIAPGATAQLDYKAVARTPVRGASAASIDMVGVLELTQSISAGLTFAALDTVTEVSGFAIGGKTSLKQRVELIKSGDGGETYKISVFSADARAGDRELVAITSNFDSNTKRLSGEFSLSAEHREISPYLKTLGFPLPDLSVAGSGRYEFTERTGDGSIVAALKIRVSNLEAVQSELAVAGELDVIANIDASLAGSAVAINKLEISVKDSSGNTPLRARNLQPFTVDHRASDLGLSEVEGDLLEVAFERLPFAWIGSYIPGSAVRGDTVSGALSLARGRGGVRIKSVKPLKVSEFSLNTSDVAQLENLELSLNPDVFYNGTRIRLEVGVAARDSGERVIFNGKFETDSTPGELRAGRFPMKGTSVIELIRMMDQPFAASIPRLPASKLSLRAEFEGALENGQIHVSRFSSNVVDGQLAKVLNLDLKQRFSVVAFAPYVNFSQDSGVLLDAELKEFPINLIAPFIPGLSVSGDRATGGVSIEKTSAGSYRMSALKPLVVEGLTVGRGDEIFVRDVTFSGSPTITLTPARVDIVWEDLELRSGRRRAMAGRGGLSIGRDGPSLQILQANGRVTADLPAIFAQPVFAAIGNVASGQLVLEGSVDLEDANRINMRAEVTDLVPAGSPDAKVDSALMDLKGTVSPRKVALISPLRITGTGGETSLELTFGYQPSGTTKLFALEATGSSLAVDDLLAVVEAFSPRRAANGRKVDPGADGVARGGIETDDLMPDLRPAWEGYVGSAKLQVGRIRHGRIGHADSVEAVLKVEEHKVSIDRFQARLAGSPLNISGDVEFRPGLKRPYRLRTDLNFQNIDLGDFLRSTSSDTLPAVEGVFSGKGTAVGEAESLNRLLEKTMGSLALQSVGGGVFRGLKESGKTKFAAGLGAFIGGVSDRPGLVALARISQRLREVPYSEASLLLERGQSLDVDLKQLKIRGPTLDAIGVGKIRYQDGVPVTEQPLRINLHLAAREGLAQDLYVLDLLDDDKNERGYWPLKDRFQPIPLTGSLGKVDPRAFYQLAILAANTARVRSRAEIGTLGSETPAEDTGENQEQAPGVSQPLQTTERPEPTPGELLLEALINRARRGSGQ